MDSKKTGEIREILTFVMGDEQYAIRVTRVREVLSVPKVTRIPRMPEYMRGVVNLRGSVVPIIDLKRKFAMGETELTENTAIIVVEIPVGDQGDAAEILHLGLFADSVRKVIAIPENEIEPAPRIGTRIDTSFIEGMGHVDDDFIVILDITAILTAEEVELMEAAGQTEAAP